MCFEYLIENIDGFMSQSIKLLHTSAKQYSKEDDSYSWDHRIWVDDLK